jgi:hypothetical protein
MSRVTGLAAEGTALRAAEISQARASLTQTRGGPQPLLRPPERPLEVDRPDAVGPVDYVAPFALCRLAVGH